jgi:hypothetical protein
MFQSLCLHYLEFNIYQLQLIKTLYYLKSQKLKPVNRSKNLVEKKEIFHKPLELHIILLVICMEYCQCLVAGVF